MKISFSQTFRKSLMPKKYSVAVVPRPPRYKPIGKFEIKRDESGCINCGKCASVCVYEVHKRGEEDARKMAEPEGHRCKGCFRCVQECPREALSIRENPEYSLLGDSYWTPEIISTNWYQAETGKIPVSGAGYPGPFSGEGFDSMWTDMSEIVRPTRDGIHGREYISTAVDVGRKLPALKFNTHVNTHGNAHGNGKIASPVPPTLTVPIPIIFNFNALPFGRFKSVYEAVARAASRLGTFMIVDAGEWFNAGYKDFLVPQSFRKRLTKNAALKDLIKVCKMVEFEYGGGESVLREVSEAKRLSPGTLVAVRVPFSVAEEVAEIVEELTYAGVEVVHLCADLNGQTFKKSLIKNAAQTSQQTFEKSLFVNDLTLKVHRHLVERRIRDEVTLVVSGGIAMAEHVAKSIICGADLTAVDLPLLLALECRYCRACAKGKGLAKGRGLNAKGRGLKCPVGLEEVDAEWAAQRIINLVGAWRNQLLEVLGAMGLREVRRLRGEVGRAIFFEEIERETFDRIFARGCKNV